MPLLSIITINYNNKQGLEETIKSVSSQTFRDFEYLVIDGGSTDGSRDVIDLYKKGISYFVSEKDNGIYHAMNKGIAQAKGDYCLFLNSGDFLAKSDSLQQAFDTHPTADIVYCDMWIDRMKGKHEYGFQPSEISFEFMIRGTIWHPVSFIKRMLFSTYGSYDESLKIVADYDFFLKTIIVHQVTYQHLSLPLAVFNTAGIGSNPNNDSIHTAERKKVQEKYFPSKVIEAAKENYLLKSSKIYLLGEWIKKKPVLKKCLLVCFELLNYLRKKLSIKNG
jgi:glycosyltransferase involved in cell wall biosynthesis